MEDIKIVIDCCGADNPKEVIIGASRAVNEIQGVSLILVGFEDEIKSVLSDCQYDKSKIEIINATENITNNDEPVFAIRTKPNSSLPKAYEVLKNGQAKALISAGSTGALLAGSMLCLGKENMLERPFLASLLPTDDGKYVCLADCGANVDCKPHQLLAFAKYSALYMKSYFGIESPKVALLSVGTEEKKGNAVTKETFALLKESGLNFIGNIEGKTVLSGDADVVVADGFSGNVLLKNIEGTAKSVILRLNGIIKRLATEKDDLTLIKKSFQELMKKLDFNTQGGAVILGIKKVVVKAHGAGTSETIVSTVKQAKKMLDGGFERFFNN